MTGTVQEAGMKVADLMQPKVVSVASDTSLAEAIVTLADEHVSGVPVIDAHHRLVGVLSTTDVLSALAEDGRAKRPETYLEDTAVRDIMTPRPASVAPETDAKQAAQQMLYLGVHRLFVEDEGQLVGVISQSDIVRAVANGKM